MRISDWRSDVCSSDLGGAGHSDGHADVAAGARARRVDRTAGGSGMTDMDESMLIAFVDGELDEVNRRRVERAVAEDPALAARLDMHLRLRERLAGHYAPIEAEPVPAAMQALLREEAKEIGRAHV